MSEFITISNQSRYKDTLVFRGERGAEFGLTELPAEFTDNELGERTHVVISAEVGFLDRIASAYYGPGYEPFWWVIAQANRIVDPEMDMFPGQVLRIPQRTRLVDFTSRIGLAQ